MQDDPRATIVIPTYNSARWLAQAVDSALAQTFDDIEVLVLDNASTDGTAKLMARYSDPRLLYRRFDKNVGFAGNVTRGIKAARGDYFIVLGADDILDPRFVATAVARLEADPTAKMVHGGAIWIDDDGVPIGRFTGRWPPKSGGSDAFVRAFTEGFCYSCVLSRMAPVKALGGMDEEWGMISDSWLFLKLCLAGDVLFIEEPLARYRVRESSLSFELYADGKMFDDHMAGLETAFAWPEASPLMKRRHEARTAVARQAFETMHLTRMGAGLRGVGRKTWQIVRAEPRVLLVPASWLRLGMALMPPVVIRALRNHRRRRGIAHFSEPARS